MEVVAMERKEAVESKKVAASVVTAAVSEKWKTQQKRRLRGRFHNRPEWNS